MADSRAPRPSTDEESAPLLQDTSHPDDGQDSQPDRSLSERVSSVVQEPLSPFTRILLVLVLVLLLLSSIFIGLFAGAQHKLSAGKGGGGDDKVPSTQTHTEIRTETQTGTLTLTTTKTSIGISTTTTTAVSTSTSTSTVTVPVPVPEPTHVPEEQPCFSPQCIVLSAAVLSSLDTLQDPCENFYDFANGGWLKQHPIPSDKGSFGNFEALAQQNRRLIQQILSEDSSSVYSSVTASDNQDPYDALVLQKLRGLYTSCMNEELLDARGAEPLLNVVQTVRKLYDGETTTVDGASLDLNTSSATDDDKSKERKRLTAAIAYLHSRGIDGLFAIDIDGDVGKDPNFMTLWFSQPNLGLPAKEYYEEEAIVDLYQSVLERLLINLADEEGELIAKSETLRPAGLPLYEERLRVWPPWPWPPWGPEDPDDPDDGGDHKPINRTEEAKKLAKAIIVFEKKLANASLDLDILYQDPIATYNPVPFTTLTDALPQINFENYLSTFAPRAYPSRVILTSTTYPASLSTILNETSHATLEAYLETRAALELASHLGTGSEAWKATRSLEERLRGIKPGAVGDRAEYCVGRVESAMGFAAGRYFVKEVFGGASREKGTKVITDIVTAFKSSLQHIKWMDKESAKAAAEKVIFRIVKHWHGLTTPQADAIRVKVGFPLSPDTRNPRSIANYYSRVNVHENTFFENMLSANINDEIIKWAKLGKQRDPETWEMYPSMVNAYFNPPANEIVFPAGILQPPFFSQDWPGYMSYGSFGQVAAHELTHAFDSAGRLYNQQGKLEQWWTNATSEGFKKVQTCIVDQYSDYTIDDGKGGKIHVNGNLTSGENIGDTGLIQAYRAWKAQYDDSYEAGNEYLLPGLNYTRDQLFFISFARAWAQNIKPESAVARVRTDPHSPNRYRVDGTVYNIPEFASAFKCSPKAKLNPPQEKRCIFW
ncbi:hypothetical protein NM688_g7264 [Phlebia brevispora]|uniref:Uncharacterized protein n=1 Tax=Phlebia brevispora TaxID=194682 RepID=A0ACC1S7A1_9APHY|nr:hypothetical protein NM688_g7264 [Phlebia brevispora]